MVPNAFETTAEVTGSKPMPPLFSAPSPEVFGSRFFSSLLRDCSPPPDHRPCRTMEENAEAVLHFQRCSPWFRRTSEYLCPLLSPEDHHGRNTIGQFVPFKNGAGYNYSYDCCPQRPHIYPLGGGLDAQQSFKQHVMPVNQNPEWLLSGVHNYDVIRSDPVISLPSVDEPYCDQYDRYYLLVLIIKLIKRTKKVPTVQ